MSNLAIVIMRMASGVARWSTGPEGVVRLVLVVSEFRHSSSFRQVTRPIHAVSKRGRSPPGGIQALVLDLGSPFHVASVVLMYGVYGYTWIEGYVW